MEIETPVKIRLGDVTLIGLNESEFEALRQVVQKATETFEVFHSETTGSPHELTMRRDSMRELRDALTALPPKFNDGLEEGPSAVEILLDRLSKTADDYSRDSWIRGWAFAYQSPAAIYSAVRKAIKFSPDPTGEFLESPRSVLSGNAAHVDADDAVTALAAALLAAGHECMIVAHGYREKQPPSNAVVWLPREGVYLDVLYAGPLSGAFGEHKEPVVEVKGKLLKP